MNLRIVVAAILGIALMAFLVLHAGLNSVVAAATGVGRSGFAILCLYALGLLALLGSAWSVLLPDLSRAHWRTLIWARMVRDAATDLLPFSHLGGFVLGARTAISHGVARPVTFASMIVDAATEILAQLVFIALGVMILSVHAPRNSFAASVLSAFAIGLGLAVVGGGLVLALQRHGRWIAGKLAKRLFPEAAAAGAAVAAKLQEIYGSPWRIGLSVVVHFCGWVASALGVWIAFRLMGTRADLVSVFALEGLVGAIRSVAFLVPNAIGVQEAAYAVLAPLFGVGAEFGLGVSLLKRARDVALGVPILLIWQGLEGHRALARAR